MKIQLIGLMAFVWFASLITISVFTLIWNRKGFLNILVKLWLATISILGWLATSKMIEYE